MATVVKMAPTVGGAESCYGLVDVTGRGTRRYPTVAVAQIAADKRPCRAYVFDYGAKMIVYRNWQPQPPE